MLVGAKRLFCILNAKRCKCLKLFRRFARKSDFQYFCNMKVKQSITNRLRATQSTLIFTLLIVAASCLSFNAQGQELVARKHGTVMEQMEQSSLRHNQRSVVSELLSYAFKFRGVPYRHGAMSPRAFDCSGFTSYVFKQFGITLDRRSSAQIYDGRRVARKDLQPGDLVFFNGRAIGNRIGHVGIVTEVDKNGNGFKFIHAAVHSGITESHSSERYYSPRYMGACRVIE